MDLTSDLLDINDVQALAESYIQIWYKDKKIANLIAIRLISLFEEGHGLEYLDQMYGLIFHNLSFNINTIQPKGLRIGILCFPHYATFRPREVVNGEFGSGSEEALLYMSSDLVRRGHRVVVYANITPKSPESLKPCNPRYLPLHHFDNNDDTEGQFDIVICWRMYEFKRASQRAKRVYLWVQDLPPNYINTMFLDGAMYLSEYQKISFEDKMSDVVPYTLAGNGLVPTYYSEEIRKGIERIPKSCFYGSNYGKGLKVLLECWGNVIERFPEATLHICFGRGNWGTISDDELNYLVSLIEKYPSIIEHGRLSNAEIAKKMMECSILSFPITHASATFEITVVQAQCAGLIPAIIWQYCIPEVCHQDSFHCDTKEQYLGTLLEALEKEDSVDRQKFIDWGMQFTWERVGDKWFELIGE